VRFVYVDIADPLRNVYDTGGADGLWPSEKGEEIVFGVEPGNSLGGTWRVVSAESLLERGFPVGVRVNMERVGAGD
jgi:hypothetical protein